MTHYFELSKFGYITIFSRSRSFEPYTTSAGIGRITQPDFTVTGFQGTEEFEECEPLSQQHHGHGRFVHTSLSADVNSRLYPFHDETDQYINVTLYFFNRSVGLVRFLIS